MEIVKLNGKIKLICDDGNTTEGIVTDKSGDSVDFSIPADDKTFRLFHRGEKVQAIVFNKDKGISFYGLITERIYGTVPTYTVSGLYGFKAMQRRENVRVSLNEHIEYITEPQFKSLTAKIKDSQEVLRNFMKKAVTIDISAGGIKFSCFENFDEGQELTCKVPIDSELIVLSGIIVYKQITINPEYTIYFYGVQFKNLDEKTKEFIIKYIFKIMGKQIKNKQDRR